MIVPLSGAFDHIAAVRPAVQLAAQLAARLVVQRAARPVVPQAVRQVVQLAVQLVARPAVQLAAPPAVQLAARLAVQLAAPLAVQLAARLAVQLAAPLAVQPAAPLAVQLVVRLAVHQALLHRQRKWQRLLIPPEVVSMRLTSSIDQMWVGRILGWCRTWMQYTDNIWINGLSFKRFAGRQTPVLYFVNAIEVPKCV